MEPSIEECLLDTTPCFHSLSLYHLHSQHSHSGKFTYVLSACVVLSRSAAAAAKSLQSCPTLCDPIDGSPPDSPIPGILQARTLEWVAISFSNS